LTWQAPAAGSAAGYRVYDVSSGGRVLVAEVAAGGLSYLRRRVQRNRRDHLRRSRHRRLGAEGSPACVIPGAAAAAGKTVRTAAQGAEAISRFAPAFRRLNFIRPL